MTQIEKQNIADALAFPDTDKPIDDIDFSRAILYERKIDFLEESEYSEIRQPEKPKTL